MKKAPEDIRQDSRYASYSRTKKHKSADNYITKKTKTSTAWAVPVILLCVIFFIAALSVTRDSIESGNPDVPVAVVMDIIILLPVFFLGLIFFRKSTAEKYGAVLASSKEPYIELTNLDEALHTTNAAAKLKALSRRGYMKNFAFDEYTDRLLLPLNESSQIEDLTGPVTVICPGCGASLQKMPDEKVQCEYCGRDL